jgi:CheY-like chemotaxis protein
MSAEPPPSPDPEAPTPLQGYTLVIGPPGDDRDWIASTLGWGQLEAHAGTEHDVLATRDLMPPILSILDDHGSIDDRREALKRLATHPALQGIPLVILSYDADIDSFSDAIARGAAAYLVKPVSPEELVEVARRISGWMGSSDRSEKRRRLRRPLLMKVEIDIRSKKQRVLGSMDDASGGGCRLELKQEIPKGELIRIILHAHQGSTHVALGGEVRWHRLAPDGVTHVIGVRFTGTTAVMAAKLLGFAVVEMS